MPLNPNIYLATSLYNISSTCQEQNIKNYKMLAAKKLQKIFTPLKIKTLSQFLHRRSVISQPIPFSQYASNKACC
ncbi:MAG: hypothetical protein D6785_09090 [Planctomycetota bacterium]|nr:MAG: hypothetical protein D6785_09090 [Planctomycetota bacterium]